ncbi:MAG TPA: ECF transporter S component [Bacillota bacterium]|jgi:riboflavin transporter FmnP|nr:ECF transporter S component [Bacillota bacterium]
MNRKTRTLVTLGVLASIAVILSLINWPIFPSAPHLRFETADVPVLIAGFAFGPGAGLAVTFIMAVLMAFITGLDGAVGALMHFLSTGSLVMAASFIYRRHHTLRGAIAGLIAGTVAQTLIMPLVNLTIVPLIYGFSREQVVAMLPVLFAFNAIKAGLSSVITFLVYKRVSCFLKGFVSQDRRRKDYKESARSAY